MTSKTQAHMCTDTVGEKPVGAIVRVGDGDCERARKTWSEILHTQLQTFEIGMHIQRTVQF